MESKNLEELKMQQYREKLEVMENYQALLKDRDKLIAHVDNLFREKDLDEANMDLVEAAYNPYRFLLGNHHIEYLKESINIFPSTKFDDIVTKLFNIKIIPFWKRLLMSLIPGFNLQGIDFEYGNPFVYIIHEDEIDIPSLENIFLDLKAKNLIPYILVKKYENFSEPLNAITENDWDIYITLYVGGYKMGKRYFDTALLN